MSTRINPQLLSALMKIVLNNANKPSIELSDLVCKLETSLTTDEIVGFFGQPALHFSVEDYVNSVKQTVADHMKVLQTEFPMFQAEEFTLVRYRMLTQKELARNLNKSIERLKAVTA